MAVVWDDEVPSGTNNGSIKWDTRGQKPPTFLEKLQKVEASPRKALFGVESFQEVPAFQLSRLSRESYKKAGVPYSPIPSLSNITESLVEKGGTAALDLATSPLLALGLAGKFGLAGKEAQAALAGRGARLAKAVPIPGKATALGVLRLGGQRSVKLAERVASATQRFRDRLGTKFESALDNLVSANPNKTTSIRNELEQLRLSMSENPKVASEVRSAINSYKTKFKNNTLERFLEFPDLAESSTVLDAQHVSNTLLRSPSLLGRYGAKRALSGTANELENIRSGVRIAQSDAFEEIRPLRELYREGLEKFKAVEPSIGQPETVYRGLTAFRPKRPSIFSNPVLVERAKEVLGPELFDQLTGVRRAGLTAKTGGYLTVAEILKSLNLFPRVQLGTGGE